MMPGKSTILRTGRMMSASPGSGTACVVPCDCGGVLLFGGRGPVLSSKTMGASSSQLREAEYETTIHSEPAGGIAPRREGNAALEASLRKLKAVDHRAPQFRRQHAAPCDNE